MRSHKIRIMLFLLPVAAFLILNYFYMPELSFRFNDGGLKYIQVKSFCLSGWKSHAIYYPGQHIDPDFQLRDFVFTPVNGKLYGSYQLLFPFLTSLLYPVFGDRGIFLLPMLAFFISVILISRTLRLIMTPSPFYYLLLFIYSFSSPVILYSITFWEHLPALLTAMLGIHMLFKYFYRGEKTPDLMLSSLFTGVTIFFRSEMLLFIFSYTAVLSGYLLSCRKKKQIIGIWSVLLGVFLLYILNNRIFFDSGAVSKDVHFNFSGNIYTMTGHDYFIWSFIAVSALALLLFSYRNKIVWKSSSLPFFIVVVWLGFMMKYYNVSPVIAFFIEFPVCLFLFFNFNKSRVPGAPDKGGLVIWIFILYMTVSLMLTPYTPHRSIRYYIVMVPFVVLFLGLRSESFVKDRTLMKLLVLFTLLSMSSTVFRYKTDMLHYKSVTQERLEFIQEHTAEEDIIIFSNEKTFEAVAGLYFNRIYFVSYRMNTIKKAVNKFNQKNVAYFYILSEDKILEKKLMAGAVDGYKASKIFYLDSKTSLLRMENNI